MSDGFKFRFRKTGVLISAATHIFRIANSWFHASESSDRFSYWGVVLKSPLVTAVVG
jgi:hypothetical protein